MCTVLKVHPSGYYKWLKQPISNLEIKNQQILQEIKKAYKESNGIYGYRNAIHLVAEQRKGIEYELELSKRAYRRMRPFIDQIKAKLKIDKKGIYAD